MFKNIFLIQSYHLQCATLHWTFSSTAGLDRSKLFRKNEKREQDMSFPKTLGNMTKLKLSIVRFRIELRSYLSKCFLGRLLQPYFCRWNSGICIHLSLNSAKLYRWNLLHIFSVFIWWTLLCEYIYVYSKYEHGPFLCQWY